MLQYALILYVEFYKKHAYFLITSCDSFEDELIKGKSQEITQFLLL